MGISPVHIGGIGSVGIGRIRFGGRCGDREKRHQTEPCRIDDRLLHVSSNVNAVARHGVKP